MNIQSIKKESGQYLDQLDDSEACQPISLLMALVYFEIYPLYPFRNIDAFAVKRLRIKRDLYERCRTAAENNFAFPWGTLLGAVSYDNIYATLFSKNPRSLSDDNPVQEAGWYKMEIDEMKTFISNLIAEAEVNKNIRLIQWYFNDEEKINFIKKIVNKGIGVVIPTVRWNRHSNHSIVVTDYIAGKFIFNNPNPSKYGSGNKTFFKEDEFKRKWFDERTDDDLIIISENPLDFKDLMDSDQFRTINDELLRIRHFLDSRTPSPLQLEDSIASDAVHYKYSNVPGFSKKKDLLILFMWSWIDQVIYWLLKDEKNKFCFNEAELYDNFRQIFEYPKMLRYPDYHIIRPSYFLNIFDELKLLNEKPLLLDARINSWDLGAKQYFLELSRNDIIASAENEFRRDLTLRDKFTEDEQNKLEFLWENDLFNSII